MMRSTEDFPDPFAPITPILAPGKNDRLMPRSTSRSGGWKRRRSRMVKMYWGGIPPVCPAPPGRGAGGPR